MPGRREVIRPDYDPVLITLDKNPDQCTQREGQYGVDYQFIVNSDSGIMWLPKAGRDALIQSGARAGDQVELCKSQRGRVVSYVATVVNDAREPQTPAKPAPVRPITEQPTSHPIQERMTHLFLAAAASLREAHRQIEADSFYAGRIEPPTWEDIRSTAVHWAISLEKKEGR